MYRPADYPSFLLYILDNTHKTVTAATALTILYTRSAHTLYFSAGALLSTLTARAIKHLLRSPRPPPPPTESQPSQVRPKKTYGLPSTHSTALTFYATYLVPLLPSLSSHLPLPIWSAQLGVIGYWVGGVWSRVELGYHTPLQVLGGVMLGAVLAVVWRGLWVGWPGFEGLLQGVIDWVWVRTFDRILA